MIPCHLNLPPHISLDQISNICASAVILNESRQVLLMMRDNYPVWTNVGGIVDKGETFEEALHREVWEEACVNIDIIKQGNDYLSLHKNDKGLYYNYERVYLCQAKGQAKLGNEGVALEWFDKNNLPFNIPPRYRVRIQETLWGGHTPILTLENTKSFAQGLSKNHIYGFDHWLSHPRVVKKAPLKNF